MAIPTSKLTFIAAQARRLVAGGCAIALLVHGCGGRIEAAIGSPDRAEDWPLVRGNSQNTGVATSSLPDKLEVVWEFHVPNGAFQATAAVVDDGQRKLAVIADADGRVYALQLANGQLVWEFQGALGFVTTPAYRDGHYFVGDVSGLFYCLDRNGKERWRFQSDQQIDSSANFFEDCVLFGSQDTHLYCLRAATGELVWKVETGDQVRCSPTIVGGRVFAAGCDGYLHVIDVRTGQPLTKIDISSPTGSTPAAQGNLVYFGTEQAGFLAVDWEKGAVAWTFKDDRTSSIRGNAAVTTGHVLFGSSNRLALSLSPDNGAVQWATTLRSGTESSPVVVGQRVFLPVTGGRLYELRLQDGAIVQEWELRGRITASPAVGFGRLVLATERGTVVCFGAKD